MKKPRRRKQTTVARTEPKGASAHNQQSTIISERHEQRLWSGPLPQPEVMEAYSQLVPGSAERLFTEFEGEAKHRRSMQHKAIDAEIADSKQARYFAFAFCVLALVVASYCVYSGMEIAATVIGGGVIGTVVGAFLLKRDDQKD